MKSRKKMIITLSMICVGILLLGGSFAWLMTTVSGTKSNNMVVGTLALTLEEKGGISLANAMPITEESGTKLAPYTFTLKNTGNIDSDYSVILVDDTISNGLTRIDPSKIRISLTKNTIALGSRLLSTTIVSGNKVLDTGTIKAGATNTYDVRVWIDYNAGNEVQNQTFKGKIKIEASQVIPKGSR